MAAQPQPSRATSTVHLEGHGSADKSRESRVILVNRPDYGDADRGYSAGCFPSRRSTAADRRGARDSDLSNLDLPPIPRTSCPRAWWQENESRFPALAGVARRYLGAPCTSVESERLFSSAGHVFTDQRNRLIWQLNEQK